MRRSLAVLGLIVSSLLALMPPVSAWFWGLKIPYLTLRLTDYNEERTLWSVCPLYFNSYNVEPVGENTITIHYGLDEYWPWGSDERYVYVLIPSSVSVLGWDWHGTAENIRLVDVVAAEHTHGGETYSGNWYEFGVTGKNFVVMMQWSVWIQIYTKNPSSGMARVFTTCTSSGSRKIDALVKVGQTLAEKWFFEEPITIETVEWFIVKIIAEKIMNWWLTYTFLEMKTEEYNPPLPGPDPNPSFASIKVPSEAREDSIFYVEFVVLNDGGTSPEAYATVTFSEGLEVLETNGELRPHGSTIWHRDGYQISAQYKLIDYIATPFVEGNTELYWARVKVAEVGDQWIMYRLCFDKHEEGYQWVYKPTEGESPYTDQQGWPVYKDSISVISLSPNVLFDVIASAPDEVVVNEEFTVTAYVLNEGTAEAHSVVASLTLDPSLSLVSGEASQNLGDIPPSVELSCDWTVIADFTGEFTLIINVYCSELSGYQDDETILVHEAPSLSCEINVPERVANLPNLRFHAVAEVTNTGETWIYDLTVMLTFSSHFKLVHGDNPQEELKISSGGTWTPNWLLEAIAPGVGWVEVNVDSATRVDCQDHKAIEVYDPEFTGILLQTLPYGARSVATGDVDGDGCSDMAIGSDDHKVYAIKSDGSELWNYTTDAEVTAIAIGDLDGDGYSDVACGTGKGSVYAIKSNKDPLWNSDCGSWMVTDIELGDFDGDEKMDVAVASSSGYGKVCAFRGYDGDRFWGPTLIEGYIRTISVGDIDSDGKDDTAVEAHLEGAFAYRGYDGTPLFVWEIPEVRGAIAVGDLDSDGYDEVVVCDDEGDVYALKYDGDMTPTVLWHTSYPYTEILCVDLGDLDGDGEIDVAIGTEDIHGDNICTLHGSDGDKIWCLPLGDEIFALDIGDLDDDGVNDVAAGGYSDHNVWVILSPDGTIFWNYTVDSSIREHCVIIDDINCDDVKDIIVAAHDGNVYVLTCKVKDNDGPATDFLSVDSDPCRTNPQLNATITDAVSNIVAAEYFIDTAETAGSGTPMTPCDGDFNSKLEVATVLMSISGLADGSHVVFVHGRDSADNWGEFSNCTFTIDTEPPQTEITDGPTGVITYKGFFFMWTASDTFTDTHHLEFSYMLQGYDTIWSNWTHDTAKGYYDLPEGNYTFKVKARDQAGNIDPTPAERSFTIGISIEISNLTIPSLRYGSVVPIEFLITSGAEYANITINMTITFNSSPVWWSNATFNFPSGNTTLVINHALIEYAMFIPTRHSIKYTYERGWDTLDLSPPDPYKNGGNTTVTVQLIRPEGDVLAEIIGQSTLLPCTRDCLWDRLVDIILVWPGATAEQREGMWDDIVKIILLWPTV